MAVFDRMHPELRAALDYSPCDFNAIEVERYMSRTRLSTTLTHIKKSEAAAMRRRV